MKSAWFRLIRWENLLIIAIAQLLIYYLLLSKISFEVQIETIDVLLFVLCTLIVAASGFVINDLLDVKADFINRPFEDCLILNYVGISAAIRFYYFLIFTGGVISLYLSIRHHFYYSFLIYPITVYMLWIYSKFLKCRGYLGNVFVAFCIALTVLMIPYFFSEIILQLSKRDLELFQVVSQKLFILSLFAFIINLFRELVKDLEDYEGDVRVSCNTGCVRYGRSTSIIVAKLILVIFFGLAIVVTFYIEWLKLNLYYFVFVLAPICVLFISLMNNTNKINFSIISFLCKIYMLLGLIFIILQ